MSEGKVTVPVGKNTFTFTVWVTNGIFYVRVRQVDSFLLDDFIQQYLRDQSIDVPNRQIYVSLIKNKWNYFIRDISFIPNLMPKMQPVYQDIAKFITSKKRDYKGYFVVGPPGIGKTYLATYIAQTHKRQLYDFTMNHDGMSEQILKGLLNQVERNSIILFDEFTHQFTSAIQNPKVNISEGSILSAFAGAIPLPEGTILLLTANTTEGLNPNFLQALCRPGRIDNFYELT